MEWGTREKYSDGQTLGSPRDETVQTLRQGPMKANLLIASSPEYEAAAITFPASELRGGQFVDQPYYSVRCC